MTDLREAMAAAERHGMTLTPSPENPALGRLRCKACGWPSGDQFDVVIARFAKEPHGCVCEGKGTEAQRLGHD